MMEPAGRTLLVVIAVIAVARVSDVGKVLDYAVYDTSYLAGRASRENYLARFGGPGEKFSALAVWKLANYLRMQTSPSGTVLLFGYSPGALVQSNRRSASRFFWSKPVVNEFGAGMARYGSIGLLADVKNSRPEVVVLERHDEGLDEIESASYFLGNASLKNWLASSYDPAGELEDYLLWKRRD